MVIEAHINGQRLVSEIVPDEYFRDIEGATWQENIAAREQIVAMHLEAFRKKMEKVFQQTHAVTYYLIFESKKIELP